MGIGGCRRPAKAPSVGRAIPGNPSNSTPSPWIARSRSSASLLGQLFYGFIVRSPAQDLAVAAGVGTLVEPRLCAARQRERAISTFLADSTRPAYAADVDADSCSVGLLLTAILFLLKTGAYFSRGAILLFCGLQLAGLTVVADRAGRKPAPSSRQGRHQRHARRRDRRPSGTRRVEPVDVCSCNSASRKLRAIGFARDAEIERRRSTPRDRSRPHP